MTHQRRRVLRAIGVGSATAFAIGRAGARGGAGNARGGAGNQCPDCPDGTRRLAKYEFDESTGEFYFEKGACDDAVSGISYQNKAGETNEPIQVSFTSLIYLDDVVVKYGSECERASESAGVTFSQDGEKDGDGFEGTITIEDPKEPAISHFSLCAGVCYQADFVFGEPIEDLGEELYGPDRRIAVRWGGTSSDEGEVTNYRSKESEDGDLITTDEGIQFSEDGSTASVSFDVALDSEDVTVSLVSYAATCPPNFDRDTVYLQDLYSSQTVTYTSDVTDTLEIDLPGLDQLDELCDI
jgi:hypothetical protein